MIRFNVVDSSNAIDFDVQNNNAVSFQAEPGKLIVARDYDALENRPSIAGVVLTGDKSLADLGIADESKIPTKTSELTNDSGFLTQHQSLAGYATESWVQGQGYLKTAPVTSVNGQTGAVTVTVPTKVSDLTNDSAFLTLADLPIYDGTVV